MVQSRVVGDYVGFCVNLYPFYPLEGNPDRTPAISVTAAAFSRVAETLRQSRLGYRLRRVHHEMIPVLVGGIRVSWRQLWPSLETLKQIFLP